jgi:hypothetical protein
MDGAGKIAAGIVLAAVVLVVGFVGYREHERNRDQEEAAQFIQQLNDQGTAMVQQYQHADAVASARRAESSERARRARMLAPSQQCIAGTVVSVNGSTYTQSTGADGRPVACSGRYRLR